MESYFRVESTWNQFSLNLFLLKWRWRFKKIHFKLQGGGATHPPEQKEAQFFPFYEKRQKIIRKNPLNTLNQALFVKDSFN